VTVSVGAAAAGTRSSPTLTQSAQLTVARPGDPWRRPHPQLRPVHGGPGRRGRVLGL